MRPPQFGDQDGEGCSLPLEIHIHAFVAHIYLQSDASSGGGAGVVTLTHVTAAKRMWEGEHAQI